MRTQLANCLLAAIPSANKSGLGRSSWEGQTNGFQFVIALLIIATAFYGHNSLAPELSIVSFPLHDLLFVGAYSFCGTEHDNRKVAISLYELSFSFHTVFTMVQRKIVKWNRF